MGALKGCVVAADRREDGGRQEGKERRGREGGRDEGRMAILGQSELTRRR